MQSKKDYLYIFVHIPKTGGTTLVKTISKNLKKENVLNISSEKIYNEVRNIPRYRREKIKFIHGHFVKFGIHKYFKRPYRYITIFRNPQTRIVSIYNYFKTLYLKPKDEQLDKRLSKIFTIKGKVPNFDKWYKRFFTKGSQDIAFQNIYELLVRLQFINKHHKTKNQYVKDLDKFYFIAINKHYNKDSAFIYSLFNTRKYFINENVSTKFVDYKKYQKNIKKDNAHAYKVFLAGKDRRRNFYKNNRHLEKKILIQRIRRSVFLPFTQVIFEPGRLFSLLHK